MKFTIPNIILDISYEWTIVFAQWWEKKLKIRTWFLQATTPKSISNDVGYKGKIVG